MYRAGYKAGLAYGTGGTYRVRLEAARSRAVARFFSAADRAEFVDGFLSATRPREALSSGHYSVDLQLADAVSALDDDETTRFLAEFPEWKRVEWEGSWIDTAAMGVDVEWSSWAIDWIEANTSVQWDDGEPYRFDMSR